MNAAQKAVYINAQSVAMMAEIAGMQAENQHRLNVGQSVAYGDEAFIALAEKYGLTEAKMKAFFDPAPIPAPKPPLVAVKEEYGPGVTYKGVKPDFPKADNEYAIWRAIGSLTQRVRDLEQPTAPEPPKDTIVVPHSIDQDHVRLIGKRVDPTVWLEAKLPTEVEALYSRLWIAIESAGHVDDATLKALMDFHIGLASLWPKAGQVPSVTVTQLVAWAEQEYPDLYNHGREIPGDFFTRLADHLSRMGQPAQGDQPVGIGQIRESEDVRQAVVKVTHDPHYHAALDHDLNRLIDIVASEAHRLGDQPSPVTAEKLADAIETAMAQTIPFAAEDWTPTAARNVANKLLKAFPTLGQGRLTREQIVKAMREGLNVWERHGGEAIQRQADALLALQGPMTVSKEQWNKLFIQFSRADYDDAAGMVKAWLKAEFGMEVADD